MVWGRLVRALSVGRLVRAVGREGDDKRPQHKRRKNRRLMVGRHWQERPIGLHRIDGRTARPAWESGRNRGRREFPAHILASEDGRHYPMRGQSRCEIGEPGIGAPSVPRGGCRHCAGAFIAMSDGMSRTNMAGIPSRSRTGPSVCRAFAIARRIRMSAAHDRKGSLGQRSAWQAVEG